MGEVFPREPSPPGLPASLAAAAFLAAARFSKVISSNSNGGVSMGDCMCGGCGKVRET